MNRKNLILTALVGASVAAAGTLFAQDAAGTPAAAAAVVPAVSPVPAADSAQNFFEIGRAHV